MQGEGRQVVISLLPAQEAEKKFFQLRRGTQAVAEFSCSNDSGLVMVVEEVGSKKWDEGVCGRGGVRNGVVGGEPLLEWP